MKLKKKSTWTIEWDDRAKKELKKLDYQVQKEILNYLRKHIEGSKDPRSFGKILAGNKEGLWRYRMGDYRLICKIEDHAFIVLVLGVGHRKEIYKH